MKRIGNNINSILHLSLKSSFSWKLGQAYPGICFRVGVGFFRPVNVSGFTSWTMFRGMSK